MVHEVKVRQPLTPLDLGIVERALGDVPLDLRTKDYVPAPYITIDGRINPATSFYLWHHCRSRPHLGTATRIAGDLRGWVDFLVNERKHPPFIDERDPVLMATEDDWAAFTATASTRSLNRPGFDGDSGYLIPTSISWWFWPA